MNLKPIGDRIVIKVLVSEEKTKSGIVLPDTAKEKPQKGEVVAIGKGKLLDNGSYVPAEVAVGDTVIYSKYAGSEIKIDDVEYLIVESRDILAVIA